jgi:hypothetical protein
MSEVANEDVKQTVGVFNQLKEPTQGATYKDLMAAAAKPVVAEAVPAAPVVAPINTLNKALEEVVTLASTVDPTVGEKLKEVLAHDPTVAEKIKDVVAQAQAKIEAPVIAEAASMPTAATGVTATVSAPETESKPKAKKGKKAKAKTDEGEGEEKPAKEKKSMHTSGEKAAKKDNPLSWGQNGPSVKLALTDLNDKEKKILKSLAGITEQQIEPKPITEIASVAFPDADSIRANSWTRNSLRRLIRGKLVDKVERGMYRISQKGWTSVFKTAFSAGS